MCGIAGLIAPRTTPGIAKILTAMNRALAHRGPNSQGSWQESVGDWTVGLTQTRLSIIDVSDRGRQPMPGPGERTYIAYNGEVYNFQDLRNELGPTAPFHSGTDTEVILHGYDIWRERTWDKLRGMFALGLWDRRRRQLHLVRDPLGIKPLYVYRTSNLIVFASELRALLASGLVPRTPNGPGIASYLRYGSVEAPRTVVEGVVSLLPGRALVVDVVDDHLQFSESIYGESLFERNGKPSGPASREKAVGELSEILQDSVRKHLISDVPLGVFLSGGIDSSALVALIQKTTREQPRTFSVVFAEKEFTEASHAKLVADTFGALHHEIPLSESDLLAMLPAAMGSMDQPSTDGVNTYVVSQAVKQAGITVALSGMGGDELFAGYSTFRRAARLRWLSAVPRTVRRPFANIARRLEPGSVKRRKLWDLMGSDGSPQSAYHIFRRFFSTDEILQFVGRVPPASPFTATSSDPINAMSQCELRGYLANTLLRDGDSMSMAHALEVRVPFVDRVVVDYVLRLPGQWKLESDRPKPLLLDALGGVLPEQIWKRKKMGFSLPFRKWMQEGLSQEIEDTLSGGYLDAAGVSGKTAMAVWRQFRQSPQTEFWARPLALYGLAKWLAIHEVRG